MDFFDNSYYRLNKLLMSVIGQWPHQPKIQRNMICTLYYFTNSAMLFTMVWGFINCDNFDDGALLIIAMTTGLICCLKMCNAIFHSKDMLWLLDEIKLDWMALTGLEIKILSQYVGKGKFLTFMFTTYCAGLITIYCLGAYSSQILDNIVPLNETRPIKRTYQSIYFVDEIKYFYPVTLHEQMTSLINIIALVALDCIYVQYVEHVCGMFAVLRYRLKNILKDDESPWGIKERYTLSEKDKITNDVLSCISLHQKIIKFVDTINSTFSTSLFSQLGLSIILLSISGYMTLMKLENTDEFMQFFPYLFGQFIVIFFECLPGQKLLDGSEKVRKSIYAVKWYKMPVNTQKLFIFQTMRSYRPCKLEICGGLYVMSLETFSSCIRTSFSYFTILLSMQE